MPKPCTIALAADSLQASSSGIGRVARLMGRALTRLPRAPTVLAVTLQPAASNALQGTPIRSALGSRVRFVYEVHRAAMRAQSFFYDFAGIARAHPRLPGLRRPYAVWGHGIEIWEEARADRLAAIAGAQLLFVNTEYTKQRAARLHRGFERAQVCWLGTETDTAPAPADRSEGPPTLLMLSRLDEGGGYKGHRELIEAWPKVTSAVPDARLCIAGGGPGAAVIARWVASSAAQHAIDMPGFVPEAGIEALWSRATVFGMPSRGEGFGLAYIEAMRHAVPVLGSVHDAASEVNVDGVTGYNADLDRPGDLAERVIELLRDRDRAQALGAAGQARWREHFTNSAFERRFLPLAAPLLDHIA